MLVVTQQHRAQLTEAVGRLRRTFGLIEADRAGLIGAGLIEGRVSQETEASDLDQRRRAADQGEGYLCRHGFIHAGSNSGTCFIAGTSTRPLSVMRISGMTESGIRLKPI